MLFWRSCSENGLRVFIGYHGSLFFLCVLLNKMPLILDACFLTYDIFSAGGIC